MLAQTPEEPGISCAYILRSTESVNSQCRRASPTQTIFWPVPLLGHCGEQPSKEKEGCSAELWQREQCSRTQHHSGQPACKEVAFKWAAARMGMGKIQQWERHG